MENTLKSREQLLAEVEALQKRVAFWEQAGAAAQNARPSEIAQRQLDGLEVLRQVTLVITPSLT